MIRPGGPEICGACLTIAHEPRPDCPNPWVAEPDDLPLLDAFERNRKRNS